MKQALFENALKIKNVFTGHASTKRVAADILSTHYIILFQNKVIPLYFFGTGKHSHAHTVYCLVMTQTKVPTMLMVAK